VRVVGHQYVGMQRTLGLGQRFTQPVQIAGVVVLAKETGLAVVPALDDVQRNTIKLDAAATGQEVMIPPKNK
jgi:hypothetical protein